jgi:hypothetical protein
MHIHLKMRNTQVFDLPKYPTMSQSSLTPTVIADEDDDLSQKFSLTPTVVADEDDDETQPGQPETAMPQPEIEMISDDSADERQGSDQTCVCFHFAFVV